MFESSKEKNDRHWDRIQFDAIVRERLHRRIAELETETKEVNRKANELNADDE